MIDGGLLVIFFNLFFCKNELRVSFDMTSLAPTIFKQAESLEKSIYLVGSKSEEIDASLKAIKENFPRLKVLKHRNGYFSEEEWKNETSLVAKLNPDIVIAGIGTPIQEHFLIELRSKGWTGTGYTCGGFFHQTANGLEYYPKYIDKFNLRWLYRIYDEPKLIKRYTLNYTAFIFVFIYDVIRYKLSR
jgi:N-acetylglucosaminyldiphosphoundecaprenol N-acetyl-beta-D-mannosaminyltransferase